MKIDNLFDQKGIIGKGFNLHEKCIRYAHLKQEGEIYHVIDLQELPMNNAEKVFVQMALQKLGVDGKTPLAMNINDQKLVMKKLFVPPVGKDELLEALRFQFMEETQSNLPSVEIRFEKLIEENDEGMQAYLVYGLPPDEIDASKKQNEEFGLQVIAAEPLAVTLASMLEILEFDNEKIRAIFYKEGKKTLFAGMRGTQLTTSKSFGGPAPEGDVVQNDWMIEFQQAIDEFLVLEKVSILEEAILVGEWPAEEKEKILMTLGIPCRDLNSLELTQFIFASPELKEKFVTFLPEVGLALFPKAIT